MLTYLAVPAGALVLAFLIYLNATTPDDPRAKATREAR